MDDIGTDMVYGNSWCASGSWRDRVRTARFMAVPSAIFGVGHAFRVSSLAVAEVWSEKLRRTSRLGLVRIDSGRVQTSERVLGDLPSMSPTWAGVERYSEGHLNFSSSFTTSLTHFFHPFPSFVFVRGSRFAALTSQFLYVFVSAGRQQNALTMGLPGCNGNRHYV